MSDGMRSDQDDARPAEGRAREIAEAAHAIRSGVRDALASPPRPPEPMSVPVALRVLVTMQGFGLVDLQADGELAGLAGPTAREYAIAAAVQDEAPMGCIPPEYSELEREALRAICSYQIRASKVRTVEDLSLRNKQLRKLVGALVLGLLELRKSGAAVTLVAKDVRPWMEIACPYCKAPAGSRCRDKRGDLAVRPHLGRRQGAS